MQVAERDISFEEFSPEANLERIELSFGSVDIVRDDLLEGGTKQRAVGPYLNHLKMLGGREFVYASPFCGFAQVALASACRRLAFNAPYSPSPMFGKVLIKCHFMNIQNLLHL